MKYTAVYEEVAYWPRVAAKIKRVEQRDDETILEMLQREGIAEETRFLFVGWPPLQGEESEELIKENEDARTRNQRTIL